MYVCVCAHVCMFTVMMVVEVVCNVCVYARMCVCTLIMMMKVQQNGTAITLVHPHTSDQPTDGITNLYYGTRCVCVCVCVCIWRGGVDVNTVRGVD